MKCYHIFLKAQVTTNEERTQVKTQFSGSVFHALFHGKACLVQSAGFKKSIIRTFFLATEEFGPFRRRFAMATLRKKRTTKLERALT